MTLWRRSRPVIVGPLSLQDQAEIEEIVSRNRRRVIVGPLSPQDHADIEEIVARLRVDIVAEQRCRRIQALVRRHVLLARLRRSLKVAAVAVAAGLVAYVLWRLLAGA